MSITPGSSFAGAVRNAMLVPPSANHARFRLMTGLTDPEIHCYEGSIGYSELPEDSMRFSAQVSLLPATGRTFVDHSTAQMDSPRTEIGINTELQENVIPLDVFSIWQRELLAIAGVSSIEELASVDWSTFVHGLPSIQYTVYRSNDSRETAVRIVLEPADFIQVLPQGANVMLAPCQSITNCALGTSALKYISVFLDYENSRIGFCEPI